MPNVQCKKCGKEFFSFARSQRYCVDCKYALHQQNSANCPPNSGSDTHRISSQFLILSLTRENKALASKNETLLRKIGDMCDENKGLLAENHILRERIAESKKDKETLASLIAVLDKHKIAHSRTPAKSLDLRLSKLRASAHRAKNPVKKTRKARTASGKASRRVDAVSAETVRKADERYGQYRDFARIVSLYRSIGDIVRVGEEVGCSYVTVRKVLSTAGIYVSEQHRVINELFGSGLLQSEIAGIVGMTPKQVNSYLPYLKNPIIRWDDNHPVPRSKNAREIKKSRNKHAGIITIPEDVEKSKT